MMPATVTVLEQTIRSERWAAQDAEREWCRRAVEQALKIGANPLDAISRAAWVFDRETVESFSKGLDR